MTNDAAPPPSKVQPPVPTSPLLVRVVDVDISFAQMVTLLIKLALAAIPAAIILAFIGVVIAVLFGGIGFFGRH